jgi:pantoate--beta-alanine ligase
VVVLKLFSLFRPHRAYFGEKDWQQASIIRRLARDLDLDLEVVRVPIVREEGGLALSSRNRYLSPRGKEIARAISRGLFAARDLARAGEVDAPPLVLAAARELADPAIAIEYVEIFDPETLEPVDRVDPTRGARLAIAARIEGVRLIDNIAIGGEAG